MKKTFKFLLIGMILLAVSFTMVGCGKDDEDDDDEDDRKSKKNSVEVVNNTNSQELGNLLNTTVTTNTTGSNDVYGTAPTTGSWSGNTYMNEFLGIKFNMPSSWTKADSSELSAGMGMLVQDQSTGDNVIVQFEDVPSGTSAQLIYDNVKTGLEAMTEMNYKVGGLSSEILAGRTFSTMTATVSYSGVNMVQKYYIYINGDKAAYIIITVTDSSRLNTILSYFDRY